MFQLAMHENSQMNANADQLIACPDCDLLQRHSALAPGAQSRCVRCGTVLMRRPRGSIDHVLAFTLAAGLLFTIANVSPVITLELQGQHTQATLVGGARALHAQGMDAVALLVLITAVIAPALQLGALTYMLLPLRLGHAAPGFGLLFRLLREVSPWVMIEVLMLGTLVSLVKLTHVATAAPGIGLWCLAATMGLLAAIANDTDKNDLWLRYEAAAQDRPDMLAESAQ
jgi:paraquat-inducible protein A